MEEEKINLDLWQQEVLETKGNIALRSGRQVGKSTIISVKAADFALKNKNKSVMVIAATERQAYLLFEKILAEIHQKSKTSIKLGKDRPTKHKINLNNGSVIYCMPTGQSGYGIRGFTIDLLIADEAAYINEAVWSAVTPMLAVTKGSKWLLSTPKGRRGYFYECFNDETYKTFHISSEDCPRRDDHFLASERKRMTKVQYAQEYLGEFVDAVSQFFPNELIRKCMTLPSKTQDSSIVRGDYFMGVDVARMGGDETVLVSVERIKRERLKMIDLVITNKTYLTETTSLILKKDKEYIYRKIYIDDGGMGVGVFDPLLKESQTRTKVVAINNSSRPLDRDDRRKKKVLKEDLYANLLRLMETGEIELFDDEEIFLSLSSILYEYEDSGVLRIYGAYSHITEALIRAVWCMRDKTLNLWAR